MHLDLRLQEFAGHAAAGRVLGRLQKAVMHRARDGFRLRIDQEILFLDAETVTVRHLQVPRPYLEAH